jgi:methyl-accepting chemotaxis protein
MTFTIRKKLLAGFASVLMLTATVGFLGWRYTRSVKSDIEGMFENNLKGAVHLANAQDALWRLRYGFPQFLVLTKPEDRTKITDEEPKLAALINDEIKMYESGLRSAEEKAAISEWKEVSQKYFAARPKWFELVAADKMTEAAEWRAATTTPFGAGSVKALTKLIELQQKAAKESEEEALATAQRSLTVLAALVGLAMILGIGIAAFLSQSITRPLRSAAGVLNAVAQRDFTQRLEATSDDEVGEIASGLNRAVDAMRHALHEVGAAADQVSSASQQLSTASGQMSSGAQQQASSLEETAASLEEITGTVKQNADNARQANQLAVGSRDTAEKGGEVVMRAVGAMAEINNSSKKIADIITTIDEIAFQTNLLALNAAVEAARAGEQGRGFAVVAAEVRSLAQRSATAAKEIKALIQDSVQKVQDGSELVNKSGQTLQEIVSSVKKVTDIIGEIAAASQEQSSGIDQVNKAVGQMDHVMQSNAAQTQEVSSTAQSLALQAHQLQILVGKFKLDGDTDVALGAHTRPGAANSPIKSMIAKPRPKKADAGAQPESSPIHHTESAPHSRPAPVNGVEKLVDKGFEAF